jgi:GNAT superfamily N-acetyltransferase
MADHAAPEAGDVAVRLLTEDDLGDALALSSTAGWNQRADDWHMLVNLAPAGSFAATSANRIVGTAVGIDYGEFSWIAMMLVEPAYRGRGLGRRLLEAALDAVPADTPVRLDATPLGRPLYQAYGFEDETTLTRWIVDAFSGELPNGDAPVGDLRARRLTGADLASVAERDADVFGGMRRRVLDWALNSAPAYAHVIDTAGAATPVQYCFGRHGRLFNQIGPVVAAGDEAARTLARAAFGAARGQALVIDAFDQRVPFAAWLQACGFRAQRPLFRMRRPPRRAGRIQPARRPELLTEFAVLGPEFA